MGEFLFGGNEKENAYADNPKQGDFEHITGFRNFAEKKSGDANKVNLPRQSKKADKSKTHFAVANLIFLKKAITKLKGERKYRIKFPSANWAEEDIEIEIHCGAGRILTNANSRDQLGIFGFIETKSMRKNKTRTSILVYRFHGRVVIALEYPHLDMQEKPNRCFMVSTQIDSSIR